METHAMLFSSRREDVVPIGRLLNTGFDLVEDWCVACHGVLEVESLDYVNAEFDRAADPLSQR